MFEFQTPYDIGNRAAVHLGATRFSTFADTDSKAAATIGFVYDKLRAAELRANTWRFAIRRAILYPILTPSLQGQALFTGANAILPSMLLVPPTWLIGTTYAFGAIVQDANGNNWSSTVAGNVGNTPGAPGVTAWEDYCGSLVVQPYPLTNLTATSPTLFWPGDLVYEYTSPNYSVYMALANGAGVDDPGATPPAGEWLQIGTASPTILVPINFNQPIGQGPGYFDTTRNVFMLPDGYLRMTSQDPKAGSVSYLGAPSGLMYNDWVLEGNFLVSRTVYPLLVRFVADIIAVHRMDAMFCESLAARIGLETCEDLTQAEGKYAEITKAYMQFVNQAKLANGIELDPVEPPMDDYISCRI